MKLEIGSPQWHGLLADALKIERVCDKLYAVLYLGDVVEADKLLREMGDVRHTLMGALVAYLPMPADAMQEAVDAQRTYNDAARRDTDRAIYAAEDAKDREEYDQPDQERDPAADGKGWTLPNEKNDLIGSQDLDSDPNDVDVEGQGF